MSGPVVHQRAAPRPAGSAARRRAARSRAVRSSTDRRRAWSRSRRRPRRAPPILSPLAAARAQHHDSRAPHFHSRSRRMTSTPSHVGQPEVEQHGVGRVRGGRRGAALSATVAGFAHGVAGHADSDARRKRRIGASSSRTGTSARGAFRRVERRAHRAPPARRAGLRGHAARRQPSVRAPPPGRHAPASTRPPCDLDDGAADRQPEPGAGRRTRRARRLTRSFGAPELLEHARLVTRREARSAVRPPRIASQPSSRARGGPRTSVPGGV